MPGVYIDNPGRQGAGRGFALLEWLPPFGEELSNRQAGWSVALSSRPRSRRAADKESRNYVRPGGRQSRLNDWDR